MIIISDSSPFIAFSRINQIELLQAVAGTILIPEEVAREISEYGKGKKGSGIVKDFTNIC